MVNERSKKKKSSGEGRTRVWATVVYPESAAEDWMNWLGETAIPCAISPLHDSDVNADGEAKKAHYHVLFNFDGVKTEEQVKAIVDRIQGVGLERVASVRGYARYLCHLDNPDKTQYSVDDVKCFGGIDYFAMVNLPSDRYLIIADMMDFCDENFIASIADLMRYARNERPDWFRSLCDNSCYVMSAYLKSCSWERKAGQEGSTNFAQDD